jgi:hypothetical protein
MTPYFQTRFIVVLPYKIFKDLVTYPAHSFHYGGIPTAHKSACRDQVVKEREITQSRREKKFISTESPASA